MSNERRLLPLRMLAYALSTCTSLYLCLHRRWCLSALSLLGKTHWIDRTELSRFILFCQVLECYCHASWCFRYTSAVGRKWSCFGRPPNWGIPHGMA